VTEPDGSAPLSLGFLLWHATLRWQRSIAAALKPLDLTHVQFVLLAVLWWYVTVRKERPSQRQLAEQAGTDPMMTSQVVRALERKGLVVRAPDPDDSRARRLTLTSSGRRLARKAIDVVEAVDDEFFATVDDPKTLPSTLMALAALEGRPAPAVASRRRRG
jgi:MarR family transcriptional regulator, organic hydroperoxide resistance regulator